MNALFRDVEGEYHHQSQEIPIELYLSVAGTSGSK